MVISGNVMIPALSHCESYSFIMQSLCFCHIKA